MDIAALASVAKALGVSTVEELMSALSGLMGMGGKPSEQPKAPEKQPEPEKPAEPKAMPADPATQDEKLLTQNSALFNENTQLKRRVAELGAQIANTEAAERRSLVGELVKLGAELPATAWANLDATTPVKRLSDEPLDSLRDRVAKLSAVPRGAGSQAPITDSIGLTQDEIRICKETGCPPEKFAEVKAGRK